MRVPLDRFVHALRRELASGKVTFLIGAGVSMQAPSSLPSGPAFRDLIVENIFGAELKSTWRWLRALPHYQAKVPEIIFQQIYDCITTKLFPFFTTLEASSPNSLHTFLASTTHNGARLATTNFDLLLEDAGATSAVLHLHGDLASPDVMVVRITQVGRGLSASMQRRFAAAVRGRTLCVLGYSGNDHDIAIACRAGDPARVLWLARSDTDIGWNNMPRFLKPGARWLAASGDINDLGRSFGAVPAVAATARVERRRRMLARDAAKHLSRAERFACASAICFAIDEYERAAELAKQGLRATRNPDLAATLRVSAGNALKVNSQFDEAIRVLQPVTRGPRGRVALYEYALAQNAIGTVWMERETPNHVEALRAFHAASSAVARIVPTDDLTRERVSLLAGRIENNIGLSLRDQGRIDDAITHFERSLDIKARTGDLTGQSRTLMNLALAFYERREFARSRRALQRSSAIYEQYGLLFPKAYVLRELGDIAAKQGRRKQGLRRLEEALAVYRTIPTASFGQNLTLDLIAHHSR